MEETAEGRVFLTVYVPAPQLVITGAVHISQALAPIGKLLGYDVTIVDPRTAFASTGALSRRESGRRMAGPGAAAAQCRSLHRLRRAHPRSEDRRSGAAACAVARLFLYRRARLAENPCAPPRTAQAAGTDRRRSCRRIHAPIGLDIGAVSPAEIAVAIMAQITERLRERGRASDAPRLRGSGRARPRHEIRCGRAKGCARRDRRAYHPPRHVWCSRKAR